MIDYSNNCVDKYNIDNEVLDNSLYVVLQCNAWGYISFLTSAFIE